MTEEKVQLEAVMDHCKAVMDHCTRAQERYEVNVRELRRSIEQKHARELAELEDCVAEQEKEHSIAARDIRVRHEFEMHELVQRLEDEEYRYQHLLELWQETCRELNAVRSKERNRVREINGLQTWNDTTTPKRSCTKVGYTSSSSQSHAKKFRVESPRAKKSSLQSAQPTTTGSGKYHVFIV
jgi:hypothetical protein